MAKEKVKQTEDSIRFINEVNVLLSKGVTRRRISEVIGIDETSVNNILAGRRNVPTLAAQAFELSYGVKILTATSGSLYGLSEAAVQTLAIAKVNQGAIAVLMSKVLAEDLPTVVRRLEGENLEELKKLKDELMGD
jgi:hypothetical protein